MFKTIYRNHIQMEKTRCKSHPSEFISNFCANETCMFQLCATCICQHTEYHHRHLNTLPRYQNIKNTINLTNQRLNNQKQQLNDAKNRIVVNKNIQKTLMDDISHKKKDVQNLIRQTKQSLFDSIQRIFYQMEKQILLQLQIQKEKTGLHRQENLQKLYLEVNRNSVEIYQKAQQLNSFKYPQMIRNINIDTLQRNKKFIEQINQQIHQNQLFKMEVLYQPHCLKQIITGVKKIITTSFTYPSKKYDSYTKNQEQNDVHLRNTNVSHMSPDRQYIYLNSDRIPLRERSCQKNIKQCPHKRNRSFLKSNQDYKQRSPINRPQPTLYNTQQNWFRQKERGTPKFHQTYGL